MQIIKEVYFDLYQDWKPTHCKMNLFNRDSRVSNFSLQHHLWIKYQGQEKKGNNHHQKKLLIVWRIPLDIITGNF